MHRKNMTAVIIVSATVMGCSGGTGPEESAAQAGGGASSTATALLRVVNLVSDAPAFDVCLRAHSSDAAAPFDIGPLLASRGLSGGLPYPSASAYVALPPRDYDLRVVSSDAIDCATRLGGIPDRTDLGPLAAHGHVSLVAVGSLAKSFFELDVRSDEATAASDRARLRFIHDTVAAPALDVGIGAGGAFTPLFTSVPFRSAGVADPSGYRDVEPTSDSTLVLRVAGRTFDTLAVPRFALGEGTVTTVFSIGVAGAGGALLGSVLRCVDGDTSSAPLSSCSTAP